MKMKSRWPANCVATRAGYAKITWISPGVALAIVKTLATAGGAGMPCPSCNLSDREHEPKMPGGFMKVFGRDGWIN